MEKLAFVLVAACANAKQAPTQPAVASTAVPPDAAPRVPAVQTPCTAKLTTRLGGCVRDIYTGEVLLGVTVTVAAAGTQDPPVAVSTDEKGVWGVDASGTDFTINVYYGNLVNVTQFHVPAGNPPFLVPTIAFDSSGPGETLQVFDAP